MPYDEQSGWTLPASEPPPTPSAARAALGRLQERCNRLEDENRHLRRLLRAVQELADVDRVP
jgi:hypothetical protein